MGQRVQFQFDRSAGVIFAQFAFVRAGKNPTIHFLFFLCGVPKMSAPLCMAAALFAYEGQAEDELSLRKNDILEVLAKHEDEWWSVRNISTQQEGLIPSNYVYVKVKNESQSKASTNLPHGWESSIDEDSGEKYYYNVGTGQVQWNSPSSNSSSSLDLGVEPKKNNYMDNTASERGKHASMMNADLVEFKRLREEADSKLNALK